MYHRGREAATSSVLLRRTGLRLIRAGGFRLTLYASSYSSKAPDFVVKHQSRLRKLAPELIWLIWAEDLQQEMDKS